MHKISIKTTGGHKLIILDVLSNDIMRQPKNEVAIF